MKTLLYYSAAALLAASVADLQGATTTSGFGTIPGASSTPYGGSGIPNNTSEWVQVAGLPGSDTLTIAEAATQYKSNPAPGNNGAGTYTVGTGTSAGRSLWNNDYYFASSQGLLSSYTFSLSILNVGNGQTTSYDPTSVLLGNTGTPGSSQGNSESLDFFFEGPPIGYNANLNDTYDFTLSVNEGGTQVASDTIVVIAGTGAAPVPDHVSTLALAGLGCVGLVFVKKRISDPMHAA
jgi:hypothetical protein